jgi:hypothetical protein
VGSHSSCHHKPGLAGPTDRIDTAYKHHPEPSNLVDIHSQFDSRSRSPEAALRSLGVARRNPGAALRNLGAALRNLWAALRNPGAALRNLWAAVGNPEVAGADNNTARTQTRASQ